MSQKGWTFDKSRCVSCKACVVACKMENNTPTDVNYRWVIEKESGEYPSARIQFTSMACFHCEHPACMAACPVDGAITKDPDTGIVLIHEDLCIGCKYCMAVCPYGAPQFNEATKKVEKCTFCFQRVQQGLLPACVITCVGLALDVADDEAWDGVPPEGFADRNLTHPSIKFKD